MNPGPSAPSRGSLLGEVFILSGRGGDSESSADRAQFDSGLSEVEVGFFELESVLSLLGRAVLDWVFFLMGGSVSIIKLTASWVFDS